MGKCPHPHESPPRDGWNDGLKAEPPSYRISPCQYKENSLKLASRRGTSIAVSRPSHVPRRKTAVR